MDIKIKAIMEKYNLEIEEQEQGVYKVTNDVNVEVLNLMYDIIGYIIIFKNTSLNNTNTRVYAILSPEMDDKRQYEVIKEYMRQYNDATMTSAPQMVNNSIDTIYEKDEIYA